MIVNRQVLLAATPEGVPVETDFRLAEVPRPAPGPGEVLVRNRYLSLDPYMRSQLAGRHLSGAIQPGDLMRGETVAEVVTSKHPAFAAGAWVRGFGDWQEWAVLDGEALAPVPDRIRPPSLALSALGMPGLTAWAGLCCQAVPAPGDVLLVAAATGAVGSVVGQLGRARGCRVIGIAGSDEKCAYAVAELGYAACINRRSEDVAARLDALCPDGIDIYFDLVGGELLDLASARLAIGARVVLCGLMAEYNSGSRRPGPPPGDWIRARATVTGLVVYDYEDRREACLDELVPLVESGALRVREDVAEGIAAAPAAFCRLMRGENTGKALVKLF
jgi:NADPH-dependent curcumin reductase CurA